MSSFVEMIKLKRLSTVGPLTSPVGQKSSMQLHTYLTPNAFVSLAAAVKASRAWKYGITGDLLQALVASPFSPHRP